MRIIVTGGYGFIGSNFILYWLKKHRKDEIINVDKLTYAADPDNLKDLSQIMPLREFISMIIQYLTKLAD